MLLGMVIVLPVSSTKACIELLLPNPPNPNPNLNVIPQTPGACGGGDTVSPPTPPPRAVPYPPPAVPPVRPPLQPAHISLGEEGGEDLNLSLTVTVTLT